MGGPFHGLRPEYTTDKYGKASMVSKTALLIVWAAMLWCVFCFVGLCVWGSIQFTRRMNRRRARVAVKPHTAVPDCTAIMGECLPSE